MINITYSIWYRAKLLISL